MIKYFSSFEKKIISSGALLMLFSIEHIAFGLFVCLQLLSCSEFLNYFTIFSINLVQIALHLVLMIRSSLNYNLCVGVSFD
jgi:hypothetical protein